MNDDPNHARNGLGADATAREVLARDRRHVWHPFTQHGTEGDPVVTWRGEIERGSPMCRLAHERLPVRLAERRETGRQRDRRFG